jgi:hypothetical protein
MTVEPGVTASAATVAAGVNVSDWPGMVGSFDKISVVVPSLLRKVPVGVPLTSATAVTVAVRVTDWPRADGLTEAVKAVLLLSWNGGP